MIVQRALPYCGSSTTCREVAAGPRKHDCRRLGTCERRRRDRTPGTATVGNPVLHHEFASEICLCLLARKPLRSPTRVGRSTYRLAYAVVRDVTPANSRAFEVLP